MYNTSSSGMHSSNMNNYHLNTYNSNNNHSNNNGYGNMGGQNSLGVGMGFQPASSFRRNLYNEHQQMISQQPQVFPLHINQMYNRQYPSHQQQLMMNQQAHYGSPRVNSSEDNTEDLPMYNSEKIHILNMKTKQIPRQDPFYNYLEYSLRLAVGSVSSTAFRIYSLKEASEYHQFRSTIGDGGLMDVWINLNDLETIGSQNTLENIVCDGFSIPETGIKISVGRVNLGPDTQQFSTSIIPSQEHSRTNYEESSGSRQKFYRLMHCLFYPGKSFCIEKKASGPVSIPQGYDSVYYQPGKYFLVTINLAVNITEEQDPEFHHEFIMLKPAHIFCDFVCIVEFDNMGDERLRNQTLQHYRDFFKTNDKIIGKAYRKAVNFVEQTMNPPQDETIILPEVFTQMQQFKQAEQELSAIEARRQLIISNVVEMEAQLKEQYKRALVSLHDISQLKMSELLSKETEMRRRIEEMEWMNNFIQYQQTMTPPLQFLDSLAQHKVIFKEKQDAFETCILSNQQTLETVLPDIGLQGQLEVSSNSTPLAGITFKTLNLPKDEDVFDDQELNDEF